MGWVRGMEGWRDGEGWVEEREVLKMGRGEGEGVGMRMGIDGWMV